MTEQQTPAKQVTSEEKKPEPKKEAKKPAGKTYRPLKPGEYITRCTYILANSLQCWKAGEEEVTNVDKEGVESTYQLCERHVRISKAIDAGYLKPEHVTEVTPDPPDFTQSEVQPPPKVEEKKEAQEQQKESKIADSKQQQTSQKPEEHKEGHFWEHEKAQGGTEKK